MTKVRIRRYSDTQKVHHGRTGAETRVMCLKAKECQELLIQETEKKGLEQILPMSPQEGTNPADTLILDFCLLL